MSTPYLPDLTTLEHVKQMRGITTYNVNDDALITDAIHEASGWLQKRCDRVFVPYQFSKSYDALGAHISGQHLDFGVDVLEINTLTNGDGSAITASQYVLRDSGVYPKHRLELLPSAGVTFAWSSDWQDAITLNGTLGCHDNYPQAFKTMATATGALSTSDTLLAVSSTNPFETLQYVRHANGNELSQITAIGNGTLTLERGVLGTTAVAQSAATAVKVYQENPDVQLAVTRAVSWLYENRDSVSLRVEFLDGATSLEGRLPPMILDVVRDREWKVIV